MPAPMTHQNLWTKKVLIPFWTIQLLLLSVGSGIIIFTLAVSKQYTGFAGLGINIACIGLTLNEIIPYARHQLRPLKYLICQVVKVTIFLIVFILSAVSTEPSIGVSPYVVIYPVVVLSVFSGALIYGSVIYHRFRKAATDDHDLPVYAKTGSVDSGRPDHMVV